MKKNSKKDTKISTAIIVFFITPLILGIFLVVVNYWSRTSRNLPKLQSSEKNTALRGKIITADNYSVANSQKLYKAMIDTRSIDPKKLDLFIKLYCIYTGDDEARVKKSIESSNGTVVLSYKINSKTAVRLKELNRKLNQRKVFISFKTKDGTSNPPVAMSILESGEKRSFLVKNGLTPLIGYLKKTEVNNITKVAGVKGIEKYYDYYLSPVKDQLLKGPRDLSGNIILEKSSQKAKRIDGYDVYLNIYLKLQRQIEKLIDEKREEYDAKEIIVGIENSKTAQIIALASSARYNPENITKNDYKNLNMTATEYAYEPGSVMKPIVFSILFDKNKVNMNENINTHNGEFNLFGTKIKDTHPAKYMSVEDIIVYSSNIGMAELSFRLDGQTYHDGLIKYGFSRKTEIDIPYEQRGNIPSISELGSKVYKATVSYGYGLQCTFIQMLSAYTVFNNNGILKSPRIVNKLENSDKEYELSKPEEKRIISQKAASVVKDILIQTVNRGTGRKAKTPGLIVGGKTGTARIAKAGGYASIYNGSFFGFANDLNSSYTIGVLVREPKKGSYYAAQNALPVFKSILNILISDGYLKPNLPKEEIEKITKENGNKHAKEIIKD